MSFSEYVPLVLLYLILFLDIALAVFSAVGLLLALQLPPNKK